MMAGSYCRFCGHRCFVLRTLLDFSWSGHLATCAAGMAHDRAVTGYDHTSSLNLVASVPEGLTLRRHGDTDFWRIVHVSSGKHLPLVDWPADAAPLDCVTAAAARLATGAIDWTKPKDQLAEDLVAVAAAVRDASTTAYDAAVAANSRVDDRPRPWRLSERQRARTATPGSPGRPVSSRQLSGR
jgi:hypothetical protein